MAALESLAVGVLVAASAAFTVWRLLSARQRLRLIDWLAPANVRGNAGWRARLRRAALGGGGCQGCRAGQHPALSHKTARR